MLQSLATTSELGRLTNARLVQKLHGASISQFWVTKSLLQVQTLRNIVQFEYKGQYFFHRLIILTMLDYYKPSLIHCIYNYKYRTNLIFHKI